MQSTVPSPNHRRTHDDQHTPHTTDVALDVTPLSAHIGAEIRGIDLRSLSDAEVAADPRLHGSSTRSCSFPISTSIPAEHLAFAARLGEPTEGHPVIPGIADHPEVFEIDYTQAAELAALYGDVAERSAGLAWHTDVTFVKRPPTGSILRAVEVPEAGGDTLFSNQQAAFEGLSPSLQAYLSTLTAVHDGRHQFAKLLELVGEGSWEGKKFTSIEPVEHPVVITHPETGKRVLFVNPGFTSHIKDLSRAESDALLGFLYAPLGAAGVRRALPLAAGHARLLGQLRHPALRGRRLRRQSPGDPAGHPARHGAAPRDDHARPAHRGHDRRVDADVSRRGRARDRGRRTSWSSCSTTSASGSSALSARRSPRRRSTGSQPTEPGTGGST